MTRTLLVTDASLRAERVYGHAVGAVCGTLRLTYGELGSRCRRLASGLRARGVGRGDRVAVLMGNCHRFLESYTAVPGIGAAIVPLNTRDTPSEHAAVLRDCRPQLLIADEQHREIAIELAGTAAVIDPPAYERMIAGHDESELGVGVSEGDPAGLFYTGGTTGAPKAVVLTHRNLVANAFNMTIAAGYTAADSFLHAAPMFHLADGSSIYALSWLGARHVFVPRFDPATVLDTLARERVTCTILVPAMVAALLQRPDRMPPPTLRLMLHGGAAMPMALLRRAVAALDCSFTQAYGLTESSSLATMLPDEERLLDDPRAGSVGRPVMGVDLLVCCADGTPCPPGEVGEVTLAGPAVTSGYWNRPAETAAALRDGRLWTGDLGYIDPDGYLYLVDRAKDVIITGGENVYSTEVEQALTAHPAIAEAAVIGVPDQVWGERVHAVVVARSGTEPTLGEVRAFCKQRLAGYKCPRGLDVVDALPRSGAGKALKRELRARYAGVVTAP